MNVETAYLFEHPNLMGWKYEPSPTWRSIVKHVPHSYFQWFHVFQELWLNPSPQFVRNDLLTRQRVSVDLM